MASSLVRAIFELALRDPEAIALMAPGRTALTYRRLDATIAGISELLRFAGISAGDAVAVVLPDGVDLAVAVLAAGAAGVAVPLDPALSQEELTVRLRRAGARALMLPAGQGHRAREAARGLGLAVLEVEPDTEAGAFRVSGDARARVASDVGASGRSGIHAHATRSDGRVEATDAGVRGALLLFTSGTTAEPKRVVLTHWQLLLSARNIASAVQLTARDRSLTVMPLWHIHGLSTVFASLAAGGSAVVTGGFEAPAAFRAIDEARPTWISAAPALHHALLVYAEEHPERAVRSSLRFLRSASSPMPRGLLERLESAFGVPFIEAYGMTEAGPQVASNRLPPDVRKPGSVGRAAGPEVAILDDAGGLMDAGRTGEIAIRGENVAEVVAGDDRAREATPVDGAGGSWFLTGDAGHLDADGHLFVTGRIKELVNRGGEKISPFEVEAVLGAHPAVAEAAVFAVPHTALGENVGAAVVLRRGATAEVSELRQFVAQRVAHFKVPQEIVLVPSLPLGPAGKLVRGTLAAQLGLSERQVRSEEAAVQSTGPASDVDVVVKIASEVLRTQARPDDNLFTIGAHSLDVARMLLRIEDCLGVRLPLASAFAHPTAAQLAGEVARRRGSPSPVEGAPAAPAPESPPTGELSRSALARRAGIVPRPDRERPAPLSFEQQRLWFLDQVDPGQAAYTMHLALALDGPLNVPALEASVAEIGRRHEALRTRFPGLDGVPAQVVTGDALRIARVDLTAHPEADRRQEARRRVAGEARRAFDLQRGPVCVATLLVLGPAEHILVLAMHHIVSDAWSAAVLRREIGALYPAFAAGRASPLAPLPVQFADHAVWQREYVSGPELARLRAYWMKQLSGLPPAAELPADRPRSARPGLAGARVERTLSPETTAALRAVAAAHGATLYMAMLAVVNVFLHRYTGQEDVAVGTVVAGRAQTRTEALVGFFANTLVMRTDLSGDPAFTEVLARVRRTVLDALAHQEMPLDTLLGALRSERRVDAAGLFQVMLAFQNVPGGPESSVLAPGLSAVLFPVDRGTARFDLTLYATETAHGLECGWHYRADLFDAATIERMARQLETLVEAIAAAPRTCVSALSALSASETEQVLVTWNQTARPAIHAGGLAAAFARHVARQPDALAARCGAACLTYAELDARSNQLARHLARQGVRPGVAVALLLPRGVEMIVALLAVVKTGGAFVPLDPAYPPARLARMQEELRAAVVVGTPGLLARHAARDSRRVCVESDGNEIARESTGSFAVEPGPEDLAYVVFTSGSRGTPKGVKLTHANLEHYLDALQEPVALTPTDRVLHTASFAFSSAVRQFALPLFAGAGVVIATADDLADPAALLALARDARVTVLDLVPSYWRACLRALSSLDSASRAAASLPDLRAILSASEPLPTVLPREWSRLTGHAPRLFNMYGQTETTGIVCVHPIAESDLAAPGLVPIGRPIARTRIYLLDAEGQPVPPGLPGEIHIGGPGVGAGYLDAQLTAARFLADPFDPGPGARLYRTGDLARYRADGTLEYRGRLDRQVKVRGVRVEPGEVEAVLDAHPAIAASAVVARAHASGGTRLVAYVVPRATSDRPPGWLAAVRAELASRLPIHLVPAALVELPALPLTPHGKVDLNALPVHERARPAVGTRLVEPRTPAEIAVAAAFREVLALDAVGVDDNFFELGGDSILSVQLVDRVNRAGFALTLRHFFAEQTVARIAAGFEKPAAAATVSSHTLAPAGVVRVTLESLRAFGREALTRAGLDPAGAAIVTEVQLEATLRGQPTHHVGTIPRYARRLRDGEINPRPHLRVERETAGSALFDGDHGPGQWIAVEAMRIAISKAREIGVGVVGARRSNHFGAAGHYAWLAAQQGLIGLCTSNAPLWLAPTGGTTATFGNNPLAVGIPAGSRLPIVLDIAMSVAAKGKIGVHLAAGHALAPGWILDRAGRPSVDPADLAAGLGVPIGAHKGYGLALVLEVLAGVLTGAGFGHDHRREAMRSGAPPDLGQLFIAVDPARFLAPEEFAARVDRLIHETKSSARAPGVTEIVLPGEVEMRARRENLLSGVPLSETTYRELCEHAAGSGLTQRLEPIPETRP